MPAGMDDARDSFYNYSTATVQKADNVRLQDISFSYEVSRNSIPKLPFSKLQLYVYANNIGIIWKATKTHLDPDYPFADYPPVRAVALGIKAEF